MPVAAGQAVLGPFVIHHAPAVLPGNIGGEGEEVEDGDAEGGTGNKRRKVRHEPDDGDEDMPDTEPNGNGNPSSGEPDLPIGEGQDGSPERSPTPEGWINFDSSPPRGQAPGEDNPDAERQENNAEDDAENNPEDDEDAESDHEAENDDNWNGVFTPVPGVDGGGGHPGDSDDSNGSDSNGSNGNGGGNNGNGSRRSNSTGHDSLPSYSSGRSFSNPEFPPAQPVNPLANIRDLLTQDGLEPADNPMEIIELILIVSRHLAREGDFLTLTKLRQVNTVCHQVAHGAWVDSFENLRIELSIDYFTWIFHVFRSKPAFRHAVRRVAFVTPVRGQGYLATQAKTLALNLRNFLNWFTNLDYVDFTQLTELRDENIWPPYPPGPQTMFYWEVVLTAIAHSTAPITEIRTVPSSFYALSPAGTVTRGPNIFPSIHNWARDNRPLMTKGFPLNCFRPNKTHGFPFTWPQTFQHLHTVVLWFGQDDLLQPTAIQPFFEHGLRNVVRLEMHHRGDPGNGATGLSRMLHANNIRYPRLQSLHLLGQFCYEPEIYIWIGRHARQLTTLDFETLTQHRWVVDCLLDMLDDNYTPVMAAFNQIQNFRLDLTWRHMVEAPADHEGRFVTWNLVNGFDVRNPEHGRDEFFERMKEELNTIRDEYDAVALLIAKAMVRRMVRLRRKLRLQVIRAKIIFRQAMRRRRRRIKLRVILRRAMRRWKARHP